MTFLFSPLEEGQKVVTAVVDAADLAFGQEQGVIDAFLRTAEEGSEVVLVAVPFGSAVTCQHVIHRVLERAVVPAAEKQTSEEVV